MTGTMRSQFTEELVAHFSEPAHPNHKFLGYRGVSKLHFFVDQTQKIIYKTPPAAVAGSAQLGGGVYVTSDVRLALDYALDSAWNAYCSRFTSKDPEGDRTVFYQEQWMQWGCVHAVFVPNAKYESDKATFADFSQVNIDRTGQFVHANMMARVSRIKPPVWALQTQLFENLQTIIYPPHTGALVAKDITNDVWKWQKTN